MQSGACMHGFFVVFYFLLTCLRSSPPPTFTPPCFLRRLGFHHQVPRQKRQVEKQLAAKSVILVGSVHVLTTYWWMSLHLSYVFTTETSQQLSLLPLELRAFSLDLVPKKTYLSYMQANHESVDKIYFIGQKKEKKTHTRTHTHLLVGSL